MKKIYCVYCGEINDSNDKKCSKCKKDLNPVEHPFKEYLCDHIKDDLKGNVEDKVIDLIIKYIKSHLYGSMITVLLVTLIAANLVFGDGIKRVHQKYSLAKDGYNTVRILHYSQCSAEGSFYGTDSYQIKTGDMLGNYYDKYGYVLGKDNYVTFETFNERLKKIDEVQAQKDACYDNYENVRECLDAIDDSLDSYDYLYEPEVNENTIIDKDYVFVLEGGGCGSAFTYEDWIVGTWKTNEETYYDFSYDYIVEVATKKDDIWTYKRFLWEYYDGVISLTDENNKENHTIIEVEFDEDDYDRIITKDYDFVKVESMPYNISSDGKAWIKKDWAVYYINIPEGLEVVDDYLYACNTTIYASTDEMDFYDINCFVDLSNAKVGTNKYKVELVVPENFEYDAIDEYVDVQLVK